MSTNKKKSLVCLIVAILLFLGAGYNAFKTASFLREALHTTGTVLKSELVVTPVDDGAGGIEGILTYYPVIEYNLPDGKSTKFRCSDGHDEEPEFYDGQMVELVLNAENPFDARLYKVWSLWMLPGLFSFAGIILLVVGIVYNSKGFQVKSKS